MDLSQTYSPFRSVLLREWRRMTSRRLYFGVCIVLPLFTLFFMATIFGNGQMENIPIGIIDQDNTATSRAITRNISAVPTFKVVKHYVNEAAAREAVQKKEIYGYLSYLRDLNRMLSPERMQLFPIIIIMPCCR